MGGNRARTALLVGAGGLGAPAALALSAAGLERLLLVDAEPVAPCDLPLAPLLDEADLGRPRAEALARALARLAPSLRIEPSTAPLDAGGALALARAAGVVVDAADRFDAMFLANDAAASAGVPLAHAGLRHHTLQLLGVAPGVTGCLRCLFEVPPPPPDAPEPAPLGPLAGLAGALLGAEAARLLAGGPGAYVGRLFTWEARSGWSRAVPVPRRPGCPACGGTPAAARPAEAP